MTENTVEPTSRILRTICHNLDTCSKTHFLSAPKSTRLKGIVFRDLDKGPQVKDYPKIPWTNRLSNVAESAIRKRLSYFATITKFEDDVGIDFICEMTINDKPLLRFNVQAKGTENFEAEWGTSVPKSTIAYWLNQLDPVYLFVYDDIDNKCYWMSIEDIRYELLSKMPTEFDTIYVKMDRTHILEDGKYKNESFRGRVLPDRYSIGRYRGYPTSEGLGYVRKTPQPPRNPMELQTTKERIREGLYSLVMYYFTKDLEIAYTYCEFLTKFDPTSHYNHFEWFGILNALKGRPIDAKIASEKAIQMLEEDSNWPSDNRQLQIKRIRDQMATLGIEP